MAKYFSTVVISVFFILSLFSFVFSDEQLTITTYYPSPYGSYRELRAQRMAIGEFWYDSAAYCWPDGPCATPNINNVVDLLVEGAISHDYRNNFYSFSWGQTHVNLGVLSTTGTNMQDYGFCTVGGGGNNTAGGDYSTVPGGAMNTASGRFSIAGGYLNNAGGYASIALGGERNSASGDYSTVPGGTHNQAGGAYSIALGGRYITATASDSVVIGQGINDANRLVNNTASSLAVGFNSTVPTLFVGPSAGAGTTGNVGIGTTAPTQKLVVQDGNVVIGNLDPSGMGRRLIFTNNPNENYIYVDGWWMKFRGAGNEGFLWENGAGTERMRLSVSTGNLGIGTNNPQYKLDVNGTMRIGSFGAVPASPYYVCRDANNQLTECPGSPVPNFYTPTTCSIALMGGSCTTSCDAGDEVTGGGFTKGDGNGYPSGESAWTCFCTSGCFVGSPGTCYARCADTALPAH